MPFVAGKSLRDRLREEPQLPLAEAVGIARQVADALDHAHRQGVIHRDIKPENILLADGEALVADFGLARALDVEGGERLTETGIVLGTPAYMSPERGEGSTHIDGRSDIYALGCVLYEMLAGQPPFTGPTAQAILARHAMDPVPSLRTVRPAVGPALGKVVLRALAKVPADRFATAQAFSAALTVPETDLISEAHAVVAPQVGATWQRRVVPAAAAAAVTALAIALTVAARSRNREPAKVDPAVVVIAPFRVTAADSSLGYLREGMVDLLAAKLSGEGGLRAVEPRSVLSAWRRAAAPNGNAVMPAAALEVARQLGAGRVIDGSIVGSAGHLTVAASLLATLDGRNLAHASAEGPVDSLSALLDRLTARLLSLSAESDAIRLASLTTVSLPAIRAYLAGRVAFRTGRLDEAFLRFREATVLDSTFTLAALELLRVRRGGEDGRRAKRLALAGRDRLSPADRALLDIWAGPFPNGPEWIERWQSAASAHPDRSEIWYGLADAYFHHGLSAGVQDPFRLAAEAFQRGWTIDSTSAPDALSFDRPQIFGEVLTHMVDIAQTDGDTAKVRRLVVLGLAADSTTGRGWYLRWHRAVALGDSARRAFWADSLRVDPEAFGLIFQFIESSGVSTEDYVSSANRDIRHWEASGPAGAAFERGVVDMNGGRPQESLRVLAAIEDSIKPGVWPRPMGWRLGEGGDAGRIGMAFYWEGDAVRAMEAVRRLRPYASRVAVGADQKRTQLEAQCVLATWRAAHGDHAYADAVIRRLREATVTGLPSIDSVALTQYTTLCAALLDARRSTALNQPDARSKLEAADAAARTFNTFMPALGANLVVANVAEAQDDLPLALRAVRRRAGMYGFFPSWYLSTYLREEGRLAALTGDTAGAIRAYRHYLALRPDPEPGIEPEVDRVRQELAMLQEQPAR